MHTPFAALLLYPVRGQGGVLLVIECLGLYATLALFDWSRADNAAHLLLLVVFIIAWVFALAVFQHFAWATLRHVAAGDTEPLRTLEIDEVSPLTNYLLFEVVLLLLGIAGALSSCYAVSPLLGISIAAAVGTVLPAMLGVMVLDERFLSGLSPVRVWRLIADFGAAYVLFGVSLYVAIAALYALFFMSPPPNLPTTFAAGFVFVLGHVFAGRVMYVFRDRLHLATRLKVDPVAAASDSAIEKLMLELHRLCGVDRVALASERLEEFLREQNYQHDERIHERLLEFQDKRLLLEHNWHYVNRLLAGKRLQRAWLLLRNSLDIDPLFRPGTSAAALTLIGAAPPADATYVEALLADFERAYPDDERLPDALFARARWLSARADHADTALELFARIEREFPHWRGEAR